MKAAKIRLICLECGTRFARTLTRGVELTCPKCHGVDIELDPRLNGLSTGA